MTMLMCLMLCESAYGMSLHEMSICIAPKYGICPEVIEAMAMVESSGDPKAQNGACKGLMQCNTNIHKSRMDELGIDDIYDPYQAMVLGTDILNDLLDQFDGDMYTALTAYNTGAYSSTVKKVQAGGSYGYADKVLTMSEELERAHGK